jgi:polyisoprenoid-binding protein YceI
MNLKISHVSVVLGVALLPVLARASVKFLAVGNPAAIRIQGEGKAMTMEKAAWKAGKFSAVFHVPLDSLETGISMRDRHMKEKYLETEKFPNADLVLANCALTEVETTCPASLTLHGVTKTVAIKLKSTPTPAKTLKVNADFAVKLSDYGISIPKFANITVAEDVQIQVDSETAKP